MHYDMLMVSDVHLGNKMSRSKALLRLLNEISFEKLVLLGDIFQDLDFERLSTDDWNFLSRIRELSKVIEVVWVVGNHDWDVYKVMSSLVGVKTYKKYEFKLSDGSRNIAMHGHTLQGGTSSSPTLSRIGGAFMLLLQKVLGNSAWAKKLYKKVDSMERDWSKAAKKVREGAFKYAHNNGYYRIFCGHTHTPEVSKENLITYYNTGHWLADRCSYITLKGIDFSLEFYDAG